MNILLMREHTVALSFDQTAEFIHLYLFVHIQSEPRCYEEWGVGHIFFDCCQTTVTPEMCFCVFAEKQKNKNQYKGFCLHIHFGKPHSSMSLADQSLLFK